MLLDLPQMSYAVWLVSDFVSTPFALKLQFGIPPLPLLATYVRLMMMSRMKSMFSFTARTLRWFLSAGSTRSYLHRQNPRMCLLFYTRKTTNSFFSFMNLIYSTNRRAVMLLAEGNPIGCNHCNHYEQASSHNS
jgi:hypothetical protein